MAFICCWRKALRFCCVISICAFSLMELAISMRDSMSSMQWYSIKPRSLMRCLESIFIFSAGSKGMFVAAVFISSDGSEMFSTFMNTAGPLSSPLDNAFMLSRMLFMSTSNSLSPSEGLRSATGEASTLSSDPGMVMPGASFLILNLPRPRTSAVCPPSGRSSTCITSASTPYLHTCDAFEILFWEASSWQHMPTGMLCSDA